MTLKITKYVNYYFFKFVGLSKNNSKDGFLNSVSIKKILKKKYRNSNEK